MAVEQAMSSALGWQRETEARITRAERDLAALIAPEQVQARSVATSRAVQEAPIAHAQDVLTAVAPPPVPVQYATPPVAMSAPLPVRSLLPSIAEEPFDAEMLPDALNGGRRRRTIVWGAVILLFLGLGSLIAMAITSQAKHGL
jgi:hypothetical protein